MTEYIMNYSQYICAIDTDGAKFTCKLPSKYIGKNLGQMKFEGEFVDSVFIAPKVYGGITNESELFVKAKGLKDPISY
jgi:hypothetical protein